MTQQIEIDVYCGQAASVAGCRVNQLEAPAFGALIRTVKR
jgi:hypothetical protein